MKHCVHNSPNLIYSVGTQVVALKQVQGTDGQAVRPAGAVGVVIRSPRDRSHSYRIRFAHGFEAAIQHDQLALLAEFKQGAINNAQQVLAMHGLFHRAIYRCVIGSRAYGLDTEASDTDRRGIYLPPAELHWSLYGVPEQLEDASTQEAYWELQKFLVMALKGSRISWSASTRRWWSSPRRLLSSCSTCARYSSRGWSTRAITAMWCVTRFHAHHYLGFAATQWKLFLKEDPPRVKPLLYVYRMLLTGLHLMRTGEVEANLLVLNESAKLPYIDDLVARKLARPEKGRLDAADVEFHRREYDRLVADLELAGEKSALPERPACGAALNDLLVRVRLACLSPH